MAMFDLSNVLVVAAHPDDEVLGVGGTIARLLKQQANVTVLVVTDGSSTQYAGDQAASERKDQALQDACKTMGVTNVVHWQYPDMKLDTVPHVELNSAFEQLIRERQFDSIFTHHHGDINLDHRIIYHSVLVAARPQPGQSLKSIFTYYVNSSTEWGARRQDSLFFPNTYVDITATIETKLAALRCYADELREHPHPRSEQSVRDRAAVFGSEVGVPYAEAFQLVLAIN